MYATCHFHARAIASRRKARFPLRMCRKLFAAKHKAKQSWTALRMSRPLFVGSYLRYSYSKISLYPNPPSPGKVSHTTGIYVPTLFEQWCGFFSASHKKQISESAVRRDLWCFVLIREDKKSKRLNMFLQR